LLDAAADPSVAVVLLTGNGRGFSAGTDLLEMHRIATDPTFERGRHGFPGLVDGLDAFTKPLVVAVNGIGVGIGCTVLGFADLAFMSSEARLKCPFTALGVAPEAASSYLLPLLVARQHAEALAARPISSLVAVKRAMTEPRRAGIAAARERENAAFGELMGGPANLEALAAFAEGREADFTSLPPGW
jgi:enoyl-CoA hydratase/carnithine racemase